MTNVFTLEEGHTYRLIYKLQGGNYRWSKYEAVMTYLGPDRLDRTLVFNARPQAGTQSLPRDSILEAHDLGDSQGRSDSRHKLKKRLGYL